MGCAASRATDIVAMAPGTCTALWLAFLSCMAGRGDCFFVSWFAEGCLSHALRGQWRL